MKRLCLFTLVFCFAMLYSEPRSLTKSDIQNVMDKFFALHVEKNEISAEIIKRSFKLYIEKFDPDKIYLLEREVKPYLTMSTYQAKKITERYKKGDFSDYEALNDLIEKAITRSRHQRSPIAKKIIQNKNLSPVLIDQGAYAKNEQELSKRIEAKMTGFFLYLQQKNDLSSLMQKEKAVAFFEKRITYLENRYVFGSESLSKKEHYLTLHILKSLSKSLDAHSTFFSEEEAAQMRMSLQMQFQGVGVVLAEGLDGVVVTDLIKGSPAEQSHKIQVDDLLVEINGKNTQGLNFEQVMELMKSAGKDKLSLGLRRKKNNKTYEILKVMLEKKPIVIEDDRIKVSFEPYANGIVGKITLRSFYESDRGPTSEKDIKQAINRLEQKGPILGLVLDLRENAGGFLSQAIKVAGLFIKSGIVVVSKYANEEIHYLRTIDGRTAYNGPLVVLTSKLSASAAEIVAQALQDYGTALVVGDTRTFGKGSIQYQTVTDSSSEIFFKVTVGKYYTASERTTQLEGVKADIVVPSVFSPYLIGERFLEYPLKNDKVKPVFKDDLSDLDPRARIVFEKYYLPNLQRVITIWKKMLPTLRKNSAERIARDANFQSFLKRQKTIEDKVNGLDVDIADQGDFQEDLQMNEAVNILKDMIFLEEKQREEFSAKNSSLLINQ